MTVIIFEFFLCAHRCVRSVIPQRISYWLGLNGPSQIVDSACSSSLYAFEHAYRAIRNGQCDSAFVGGTNTCLHPYVSLQFARLGVLSKDGRCKSFDEDADGYARSETICMAYLQKAKDARRIYATVSVIWESRKSIFDPQNTCFFF